MGACAGAISPTRNAVQMNVGHAVPALQLPTDEAAHHAPVEWWYFNGHLSGTDAAGHLHCYGFEYVTFQFLSLGPAPVYVANFAITDLGRRIFPTKQVAPPTRSRPKRTLLPCTRVTGR